MLGNIKFSQFASGGDMRVSDIVVGLRGGEDTQFTFPSIGFQDSSGNYLLRYSTVGASAVNYPLLTNSSSGTAITYGVGGIDTDVDVAILPKGAGHVVLDTLTWPNFDGSAGQVIGTDGSGILGWFTVPAVSLPSTDDAIARFDGTAGALKNSGVILDDSNNISGVSSVVFSGSSSGTATLQASAISGSSVLTLPDATGTLALASAIPSLPLSLANGGTNANLTASNGGIFYSTASAGAILSGTATAGQIILSGASSSPSWSTATYPATTTINQLLYSSSANVIGGLATTNNAVLTTNASGVPTWGALTDGQIIIGSSSGAPAAATLTQGSGITITNSANSITIAASGGGGGVTSVSGTANRITSTGGTTPVIDIDAAYVGQTSLTTLGTITTGTWNGSNIPLGFGGTNAALTASNGGIVYSTASALAILSGTATANQALFSGSSTAPSWSAYTFPATLTSNGLLYASSATAISQIGGVTNSILIRPVGGTPQWIGFGANGQIPIANNSSGTVAWGTITAGVGITVTNGAGSITLSTGGFASRVSASTSQSVTVNTLYFTVAATLATFTLPATAAVGSIVGIIGSGVGGWSLIPGSGQIINIGGSPTGVGALGSVSSTNRYNCIEIMCTVANTTWVMYSSVTSGFTIV